MDMIGTVISSDSKYLLVRDFKTNKEVIVLSNSIVRFLPGDCIRIKFNGKRTLTIPPKITAYSIREIECPN